MVTWTFALVPPRGWPTRRATQRKISPKYSSCAVHCTEATPRCDPQCNPLRYATKKAVAAAQTEDMVTTKYQQIDLMHSFWWMKYHKMSSWSHLADARSEKWFWYQQQSRGFPSCFFDNGLFTSQQRGNIVLFIGFCTGAMGLELCIGSRVWSCFFLFLGAEGESSAILIHFRYVDSHPVLLSYGQMCSHDLFCKLTSWRDT